MDIEDIRRENIKRKLLKRVLFRVDFTAMTNLEVDRVLDSVKELKGNEFQRYNRETVSQYDLQMNDVSLEQNELDIKKLEDSFSHIFERDYEDGDKFVLKISSQFMYLDIYPSLNYKGTHIYYELFSDILEILDSEIKFFNITRVGMRKFNNFFIDSKSILKLNSIFNSSSFSLWIPNGSDIRRKTMLDAYELNQFGVNFVKEVSYGYIGNDKPVYLVAFDYDLFSTQPEYLEFFISNVKDELITMNNIVFGLFKETISPDFLENVLVNGHKDLTEYGIVTGDV